MTENTTGRPPRVVISRASMIKAGNMIEASIFVGNDGFAHYKQGVSDETITEEIKKLQPDVVVDHIKRLRHDLGYKMRSWDNLEKGRNRGKGAAVAEDVEMLKLQLDSLITILVDYGFPDAAKARIQPKS